MQNGQVRARGQGNEDGGGFGVGIFLESPEYEEYGGGSAELRREISSAWGHELTGKMRGNGEELVGYL